ncbi:MAG: hypothetical protein NTW30_04810, partial [Candidatus Aenigmarchaeota archaeon]|nr:hypothetical protein [Candidatus Aenigmarchaeota archaeon]
MKLIYCKQCHEYRDFTYNNNEHYNCKTCGRLLGFDKNFAERLGVPILGHGFCFKWCEDAKHIEPVETKETGHPEKEKNKVKIGERYRLHLQGNSIHDGCIFPEGHFDHFLTIEEYFPPQSS